MLLVILFIFMAGAVHAQTTSAGDYFVYVSSAEPDNDSGIILLDFDSAEGALTNPRKAGPFKRTGYLNLSEDGRKLYTVRAGDDGKHYVSGFSVDRKDGSLKLLNEQTDFGKGPCYVSVAPTGKTVLVANYSEGNICSFKINRKGLLKGVQTSHYHQGASKVTDRQKAPHPHMILPAVANDLVLVPDLGMDQVLIYQLNRKGVLAPFGAKTAATPPGSGPRHFAFHPNGQFGYSLNELDGSVTAFRFDADGGRLTPIETVSTLPADFKEFNKSADIHLTPDGAYLYASNRGHNSIAVFKVDASNGTLESRGTFPCGGEWPRAFAIDPSGQFILVANKQTHNIAIFRINPVDGSTTPIGSVEDLGAPQCIKFLKKQS